MTALEKLLERASVLARRLDKLADYVVKQGELDEGRFKKEFTMRIPADPDRDADLVFSEASRILASLSDPAVIAALFADTLTDGEKLCLEVWLSPPNPCPVHQLRALLPKEADDDRA